MLGQLDDLRVNLSQVKAVAPTIAEVRTADFWADVTVAKLEEVRGQLRGVMQYRLDAGGGPRCRRRSSTSRKTRPGRAEEARRQARRLAACRLPQPGREGAAGLVRDERDAPADQAGPAGQRGRPGGADLAGADPGPDARPARPGGVLPRLRRATRPGDPQHHRPGCGGGRTSGSRPSSSSTRP